MIIGIDIGTSYSSVAMLKDNKAVPLKAKTGDCAYGDFYSIPSSIFVESGDKILIGQSAVASRMENPSKFKDNFKKDFGTTKPYVLGELELTPDEIYVEFFKHFKNVSEALTEEKVTKAYITHPANYNKTKKQLLEKAANYAGLFDVILLDEPTAAAINYFSDCDINPGEKVLIYDFGGGTFDTVLIEASDNSFALLTESMGLEHCGGSDLDLIIYNHIVETLSKENDLSSALQSKKFRALLAEESIKIKHNLSSKDEVSAHIPFGFGEFLKYTITRDKFNDLIKEKVNATYNLVKILAENAGINLQSIDKTLCVGGTTRVPFIIDNLEKILGKKVYRNADPELAICCGAALSSIFSPCTSKENDDINMKNPTSSLGNEEKTKLNSNLNSSTIPKKTLDPKPIDNLTALLEKVVDKKVIEEQLSRSSPIISNNVLKDNIVTIGNIANNLANKGFITGKSTKVYFFNKSHKLCILDLLTNKKTNTAYSIKNPPKDNSLQMNIINDTLYFIDDGYFSSLNLLTGVKKKLIMASGHSNRFIVSPLFIYHWKSTNTDAPNTIVRYTLDGSNSKILASSKDLFHFFIHKGNIYYTRDSSFIKGSMNLYKASMNGTDTKCLLAEQCLYVRCDEDYLYFCQGGWNNRLYRISLENNIKNIIYATNTVDMTAFTVYNGQIIYFSHLNLYIYNSHTGTHKKLLTSNNCSINMFNDWIFLMDSREGLNKIQRVKVDGSSLEDISS